MSSQAGQTHFETFQQLVADCLGTLQGQPTAAYGVWCRDPLYLGAALFALWHHGSRAILLPNAQPETLLECLETTAGLISDEETQNCSKPLFRIDKAEHHPAPQWQALNPEKIALSIFTSGSTGKPQEEQKTLANLELEIEVLENLYGSQMQGLSINASVYPIHLYGLLFRLLWPLSAKRIVLREGSFFPEDLESSLERLPSQCFISGPALLKRLYRLSWKPEVAPKMVFSSGGPLPIEISDYWYKTFGYRPVEIFGSTETGGIAFKDHSSGKPVWKPFPTVQVSSDSEGRLEVRSPFFQQEWIRMGDQVSFTENSCFHLLGRVDRVVKIEEKRVDLAEMEKRLNTKPEVLHTVVCEAGRIWPHLKRSALAVVLEIEGCEQQSKQELIRIYRSHLQDWYSGATMPKYWRFVESLPLGPAGKPDMAAIIKLFLQSKEAK